MLIAHAQVDTHKPHKKPQPQPTTGMDGGESFCNRLLKETQFALVTLAVTYFETAFRPPPSGLLVGSAVRQAGAVPVGRVQLHLERGLNGRDSAV